MGQHKISVIVGSCVNDRILGQSQTRFFETLDAANTYAQTKSGKGVSVIVRPSYNETDEQGNFYREWRSLDGTPFRECRWEY